jgi:hypothetical protein
MEINVYQYRAEAVKFVHFLRTQIKILIKKEVK